MTIESVIRSISQERISTYKKPYLSVNDSESLGIYLWNKRLSSLLLPPLQIIEVSLRNALHEGYIQHYRGQGIKDENIDFLWFKTASANIPESQRHIDHAEKQLNREHKPLIAANYIAKLPFGFWVAFCDKKFDVNNSQQHLALWPTLRKLVFPGAIKNKNPLSIDDIASELRSINSLRNRIAHHETIFNDSNHYHFESALNKIVKSYGKCITVTKWINPSNLKLMALLENEANFAKLCVKKEVDKYKALPSNLSTTDITHFDSWETDNLVNERLNGSVYMAKANIVFIKCITSGLVFSCFIDQLPGKQTLPVTQRVNFIPQTAQQGQTPRANKVKLEHL